MTRIRLPVPVLACTGCLLGILGAMVAWAAYRSARQWRNETPERHADGDEADTAARR